MTKEFWSSGGDIFTYLYFFEAKIQPPAQDRLGRILPPGTTIADLWRTNSHETLLAPRPSAEHPQPCLPLDRRVRNKQPLPRRNVTLSPLTPAQPYYSAYAQSSVNCHRSWKSIHRASATRTVYRHRALLFHSTTNQQA